MASGLPAERRTCIWWAASVLVAAFLRPATSGTAAGKPLVAKPKTLAVVDQDLQRRRRAVAKDEDPAVERIVLQHVFAQPGQAIDPAAKIGRLDGRHDPHLRRDLDHGSVIPEAPAQRCQVGHRRALQMDPHLRPVGVLQLPKCIRRSAICTSRGQFQKGCHCHLLPSHRWTVATCRSMTRFLRA